jgi:hypothetical protein
MVKRFSRAERLVTNHHNRKDREAICHPDRRPQHVRDPQTTRHPNRLKRRGSKARLKEPPDLGSTGERSFAR